jgi:hypothetical protein
MGNTQKAINRVCDYRGIPPVKKGMRCSVNGEAGAIVGGNSSANFNVRFNDSNKVLNCHPYWKFQIFTETGAVYYDHHASAGKGGQ